MFPIDTIIIIFFAIVGICILIAAIWWGITECKRLYQQEKQIARNQRDFDALK